MKSLLKVVKIIVPLLIGIYLMWYFWDAMSEKNKESFFKALNSANYFWLIISLFLAFLSHLIRAYRWRYMLEPIGYKTSLFNRYNALMIGYIMNLLIPRAGEASRAAVLFKTEKVPFTKSLGTIIAERVFDLIMLGIVVLLAVLFSYKDLLSLLEQNPLFAESKTTQEGFSLLYLGLFVLVVGIVLIIIWRLVPSIKEKIIHLIKDIVAGVFSIFKSKHPGAFIGYTLAIWVLYIGFFALCFFSLEETKDIPIGGILIGFIAGTIGIMVTNGGMGAYPLLVGIVISFYIGDTLGEEEAKGIGNALGMMIWASQTIMMVVLGLISLLLVQKNQS